MAFFLYRNVFMLFHPDFPAAESYVGSLFLYFLTSVSRIDVGFPVRRRWEPPVGLGLLRYSSQSLSRGDGLCPLPWVYAAEADRVITLIPTQPFFRILPSFSILTVWFFVSPFLTWRDAIIFVTSLVGGWRSLIVRR